MIKAARGHMCPIFSSSASVSGCTSCLQLVSDAEPGRRQVLAQVTGFLPSVWETWAELWLPAWACRSLSFGRHLESE